MLITEGILLVLVTLLIVVVLYQGGGLGKGAKIPMPAAGNKGGFAATAGPGPGPVAVGGYDALRLQPGGAPVQVAGGSHPLTSGPVIPMPHPPWLDDVAPPPPAPPVGVDSYGLDHGYGVEDLAKNYRNWAATPKTIEEAQRAAWFEATSQETPPPYYTNQGGIVSPESALNYNETLVDLISDPRMRAQQANWYSEVAPKSQTSMKVDTINEAAAVSNFHGWGIYSFRFGAPSQHNPLYLTDQDPEDYALQATEFMVGG